MCKYGLNSTETREQPIIKLFLNSWFDIFLIFMARLETDSVSSSVSFVRHSRVKFGSAGQSVSLQLHVMDTTHPPVCCVCLRLEPLLGVSFVSEFYMPQVSYFLTSKYVSKVNFFIFYVLDISSKNV
jgi:hypothetical protein